MFRERQFRQLIQGHNSRVRAAVDKASSAGVPWVTIMGWLILHGPQFVKWIDDFINRFKQEEQAKASEAVKEKVEDEQEEEGNPTEFVEGKIFLEDSEEEEAEEVDEEEGARRG